MNSHFQAFLGIFYFLLQESAVREESGISVMYSEYCVMAAQRMDAVRCCAASAGVRFSA